MTTIGVIIGSLRADSINRGLFNALRPLAEEAGLTLEEIAIKELPLFNQDLEEDFPAAATAFKEQIEKADGLIVITPEYNRSFPGVLKNALDWGSRPWGKNSFTGKKTAIIGMGSMGAPLAQRHLRDVLSFLNTQTLNQPEAYVRMAPDYFAADGSIAAEADRTFLAQWLGAFKAMLDA
ncbi:MAG: NAD(P)H-dependent oxidoreductase [Propionibacteriaceae bacterium]|jgi:chromate reductase|nr:NAD(P)H-dependent oxidoreductase [Propionibacteriaceae bacterium]